MKNELHTRSTSAALLIVALVSACVSNREEQIDPFTGGPRYRTASGDLGKFIVEQVVRAGGRQLTTNSLPELRTKWEFASDEVGDKRFDAGEGCIIRADVADFPAIHNFMLSAFGEPHIPLATTSDGEAKIAFYLPAKFGAGMMFGVGVMTGRTSSSNSFISMYRPFSGPILNLSPEDMVERMPEGFKRNTEE